MQSSSILCIDDDPDIRDLVATALELEGYQVITAEDGARGIQRAMADQPHLILLDVMLPDMSGWDVFRRLQEHPRTANLPVIFLSAMDDTDNRVNGLSLGADDYIGKPFAPKELLARVRTQLRHSEEHLLSELTSLPGNTQISRVLRQELQNSAHDLYVLYIDIDNFKSYNDVYGWLRGNDLIKLTAGILRSMIHTGNVKSFLGHVGGDDFVAIVRASEEDIERTCKLIIEQFDAQVPLLYDPADRQRGYVTATDRQNIPHRFPLVTLTIAVISNRRRAITNEYEVGDIAAQLKKQGKQSGHSSFHVDQRAT